MIQELLRGKPARAKVQCQGQGQAIASLNIIKSQLKLIFSWQANLLGLLLSDGWRSLSSTTGETKTGAEELMKNHIKQYASQCTQSSSASEPFPVLVHSISAMEVFPPAHDTSGAFDIVARGRSPGLPLECGVKSTNQC